MQKQGLDYNEKEIKVMSMGNVVPTNGILEYDLVLEEKPNDPMR